jgi:hypothetical protein
MTTPPVVEFAEQNAYRFSVLIKNLRKYRFFTKFHP